VYIWRKLKRVGALLLHEAVWVLPETSRTTEQVQWLATEIQEMKGSAYYWRVSVLSVEQEKSLVQQFNEQVDVVYSDLLKRMEKPGANPQEISQQYQEAVSKDFFHSELGKRVREKLTLLGKRVREKPTLKRGEKK